MIKQVNERSLCLDVVMEVAEKGSYIHHVLRNVLDEYSYLDKKQRSFIARVSEGTIEYLIQLDAVLNRFSKTKTDKMKPFIRNLLRISVYQLLYMDSVPDHAVCSEAVKLAAKRGFAGLKGYVNGVLRTVSREKDTLTFDSLSEKYSMPEWIVELWMKRYGEAVTEKMLQAMLQTRRLYIRCNVSKVGAGELEKHLKEEHVTVEKAPYVPAAFTIRDFDMLYALESFRGGEFAVQDVSSMLVSLAASPVPGDYVLDVCAAPGGKALHMADLLRGTGHVEARDLTEDKAELIEENLERCGFENMSVRVWDATQPDEKMTGQADIVIADVPCSGLGVIGKKPDIKYRVSEEQIEQLQKLQRKILDTVYTYVKPGGTLIYSTCTISELENEQNVRYLVENYPFELISLEGCEGFSMEADTLKDGYVQLLPGVHQTDGFFIARLRRKEQNE